MARKRRIKLKGVKMFYHVFSRTAGGDFLMDTHEKREFFIKTLKRLFLFFLIRPRAYVVMSNHFHLIIETCPEKSLSDEEILERAKNARIYSDLVRKKDVKTLREKLNDISEFVKLLKQIYAQWYNRRFERKGYFWGERFKSVILQFGRALFDCILYVLLNPVRAGMVKKIEEYRYSSFREMKDKKKILKNPNFKRYISEKIDYFTKSEILCDRGFLKIVDKFLNFKEREKLALKVQFY